MFSDKLEGWDGDGGREPQEGGDTCGLLADSCCAMAEPSTTNTIVKQLSSN